MRSELSKSEALFYAVSQIGGGIAGTCLAHLMFDLPIMTASTHIRAGHAQWLSEGVATFGLVLTILAGLRFQSQAIPWLVGLYITAAYWFTASTSFANPAVTIARAFTDSFSGIRPADVGGFVIMQCVAALAAWRLMHWLLMPARQPNG